jgi:hypothetical protein
VSGTCAEVAELLGERTAGTASRIRSFVLVEHPGPWGDDTREKVFADLLGPRRWAELEELWVEHELRPLLVRRHGRQPAGLAPTMRVFVGSTAAEVPWIETTDLDGLRALDLAALADGRAGHGRPREEPLLLVCTNGAVDRCCAVRGRPLAAALAAVHPEHVMESTHLGGCRFAANLLVLPSGEMHGRLTPDEGVAMATAALSGRTATAGWRGRTTASGWAAVAEGAVREHLRTGDPASIVAHDERLHDDVIVGEEGAEPAGCDVDVDAPGGRWRVVVRTEVLAPRTSLCDDEPPWPTPVVTELHPA